MLPYDAPNLTNNDYYARAREFRAWLEDHDQYLDELYSEDSHRYFSRFVRRWNDARLPDRFYKGHAVATRSTRFCWSFAKKSKSPSPRNVSDEAYSNGKRHSGQVTQSSSFHNEQPTNNLDSDSVLPKELHFSASERQYRREKEQDAAKHAAKQKQRNERREAREWAEEQAPRATGRDAVRERRREKAASNRAMAERNNIDDDVGDTLSSDALLGIGNSFQDAYVSPISHRIAERDRAEHKRQSRAQDRRSDKDASLRERRAAFQAKEAETMTMLRSLAQQRFA
ncbi:hypothetical protein MYAM1_000599 [Malassezia yamatoensis]|uniref:Uncharacterized protein n=1 Tax=Malassezia yamatoensis TaxID=253288 RepID=A0AAJ5YP09_9BASI|nr:hypothetical protein MYAM1_000599 [Malassezia yamatoensis]